jgi:hypothetical protein
MSGERSTGCGEEAEDGERKRRAWRSKAMVYWTGTNLVKLSRIMNF